PVFDGRDCLDQNGWEVIEVCVASRLSLRVNIGGNQFRRELNGFQSTTCNPIFDSGDLFMLLCFLTESNNHPIRPRLTACQLVRQNFYCIVSRHEAAGGKSSCLLTL